MRFNLVDIDSPLYALLVPDPPERLDSEGRPIQAGYLYRRSTGDVYSGAHLLAMTWDLFRDRTWTRLLTDVQAKALYGCTCERHLRPDIADYLYCHPSCPTHGTTSKDQT